MRIVVAIYQYIDLINKVFKENLETLFPRGTRGRGGGGGGIEYQLRKSMGRGTPTKLEDCVYGEGREAILLLFLQI